MSAPVRPDIPDEAEFQEWRRRQRQPSSVGNIDLRVPAESTGVQRSRAPLTTSDDADFQRWKAQRAAGQRPGGVLAPLAQGATLGFADEILGVVEGANEKLLNGGSFRAGYERGRDKVRDFTKGYAKANPKTALAAELAGGLATGGAGLARNAARTGLKGALAAAAEGSAYGGLAGAGSGEGSFADQLANVGRGVVTGSVVGATVPAVGAGLRRAVNAVRGEAGAASNASRLMARALERDNLTVPDLRARLAEAAAARKPVGIVDVAGRNTRGLARAAQAVPSRAKEAVADALDQRHLGQSSRITNDLEGALGFAGQDVHDVADQIIQRRSDAAGPLFEQFRQAGVLEAGDDLAPLLESPFVRRAIKQAKALPKYKDLPDTHAAVLDKVYKNIGGKADAARRAGDNVLYHDLSDLRVQLRDAITTRQPVYGKALDTFSGESAFKDALESGRSFLNTDHRVTTKALDRMGDGEREMYRVGALDAIRKAMDSAGDAADLAKRVFGSVAKRDQLRALLGDDAAYQRLERALTTEGKMAATRHGVLGNSVTARANQEIADLADTPGPALMTDVIRSGPATALLNRGLGAVQRRAQGVAGKTADELSGRLTAGIDGGGDVDAILREIEQLAAQRGARRLPARAAAISAGLNQ